MSNVSDDSPSPGALGELGFRPASQATDDRAEASHRRPTTGRRAALLAEIQDLAGIALAGTISESLRTCNNPACSCRGKGPKHGPYIYVNYRRLEGSTARYYVVNSAHAEVRRAIAAWDLVQDRLRELSEINREELLARAQELRQAGPTSQPLDPPPESPPEQAGTEKQGP